MVRVVFGNHSSVIVPRQARDSIRRFYCDVLGARITRSEDDRDFVCLGGDFYVAFLYGEVPDESEFLRTARSVWLEIKSDDVEEVKRQIVASGVRRLEVPDPHLYFQAPGGQVLRLVGIDEDLSPYEGAVEGPSVARVKAALATMSSRDRGRSTTRARGVARGVADLSRGVILAAVEIEAPTERVFVALTTSEQTAWCGAPDNYRITSFAADLRRGGAWRADGVSADGEPFVVRGEILEVEPPHRLAQTCVHWRTDLTTTVRYQIDAVAGGSRVTVCHEGFGDRTRFCDDHVVGWERTLGWLRDHFARGG